MISEPDATSQYIKDRTERILKDLGASWTAQHRAGNQAAFPPAVKAIAHRFAMMEARAELVEKEYADAKTVAAEMLVKVIALLEKAEMLVEALELGDIDGLVG